MEFARVSRAKRDSFSVSIIGTEPSPVNHRFACMTQRGQALYREELSRLKLCVADGEREGGRVDETSADQHL